MSKPNLCTDCGYPGKAYYYDVCEACYKSGMDKTDVTCALSDLVARSTRFIRDVFSNSSIHDVMGTRHESDEAADFTITLISGERFRVRVTKMKGRAQ